MAAEVERVYWGLFLFFMLVFLFVLFLQNCTAGFVGAAFDLVLRARVRARSSFQPCSVRACVCVWVCVAGARLASAD